MKPTLEALKKFCPKVDDKLILEHLNRLQERYFERFTWEDIGEHLDLLAGLSAKKVVNVALKLQGKGEVQCTVCAFDYPFVFSLITGVLAAMGFSIQKGEIFTYAKASVERAPRRLYGRRLFHKRFNNVLKRRRIIDHFVGTFNSELSFQSWKAELEGRLREVLELLERGDSDSVNQAKQFVNEKVTQKLEGIPSPSSAQALLYPVEIAIDNQSSRYTRLKVISQDTPAFLYSFCTALSLHGLVIEHVRINTLGDKVEDEIDLVNTDGSPLTDPKVLNQVKLSVLLTKQFTHFLGKAPDPYTALSRFEQLVGEILKLPESERWVDTLSSPQTMGSLAKLLGASDYVWEDFIRLQYESLLELLPPAQAGEWVSDPKTLEQRMAKALKGETCFEEQKKKLNRFKDRELYLIDLDHILNPAVDFRLFAERLSLLAEQVVQRASFLVAEKLRQRYGRPCTVAGLEVPYAIMGLGKLGGAALGYASDIELLFVYSDNGRTDGDTVIENSEYFNQMVREVSRFIEAKREGIFQLDLRLRPYGNSGPLACNLESFCQYYGPSGPAHSYERLAMVRMRRIGGDAELGAQVERLRDEFLYRTHSIDTEELRELRAKQFAEKTRPDQYNAKFSPGALVDLEYAVQILQVMHGTHIVKLRTPRIHQALRGLEEEGLMNSKECQRITEAYDFLRRLINGLRMLRGSAVDLFLPAIHSDEFLHLARRMGYALKGDLNPAQQLFVEFETRTAAVRSFVEQHFGRALLPGRLIGNVADLILLGDESSVELRQRILQDYGFQDAVRAHKNLCYLAGGGPQKDIFARLAVLACDMLRQEPDPDMALNNWERFTQTLTDPSLHYEAILSQPKRLKLLLGIFSRSQFLADTLIRYPELLDWVTTPEVLHRVRKRTELEEDLRACGCKARSHEDWLKLLRYFRRKEMLRIGTRDMCLGVPLEAILSDLSALAEAIVQVAVERIGKGLKQESHSFFAEGQAFEDSFAVLAFGKLGGSELNYSSDIDLVGIFDDQSVVQTADTQAVTVFFSKLMERLRADLSDHTVDGYTYRIDLRLRPYGRAGSLVYSLSALKDYYRDKAALWEIQALLKLRPIAGSMPLGKRVMEELQAALVEPRDQSEIAMSICKLRKEAVGKSLGKLGDPLLDIKSGVGGIRDIEFLVQGLQWMHATQHSDLLEGNTLHAVALLKRAKRLSPEVAQQLVESYIFLRRVEHYLQILHDRQNHVLPKNAAELSALAKRVLGLNATPEQFNERLQAHRDAVRSTYLKFLTRIME